MKFAATSPRRSRTSSAAQQVASQRLARRRRREQRRRRFAQQWQRVESSILGARRHLPRTAWPRLRVHMPGFSGYALSKLVSLALLTVVVTLLFWFHDDELFFVYRENVRFSGATYLTDDELYTHCDVESWSVLWLDPALIRNQVMQNAYVADAHVEVRWPADVSVTVREVEARAIWSTEDGDYWLLDNGRALPLRTEPTTGLVRIVDPLAEARAPVIGDGVQIKRQVMESALALADRMPTLREFWYNASYGLNFAFPGSKTWVYWGDGRNFEEKWRALSAARPQILSDQQESRTYNVIAPRRPFFRHYADPPQQQQ